MLAHTHTQTEHSEKFDLTYFPGTFGHLIWPATHTCQRWNANKFSTQIELKTHFSSICQYHGSQLSVMCVAVLVIYVVP